MHRAAASTFAHATFALTALAALAVTFAFASQAAHAQTAPPPPDARLDLVRGPLITSSRIMGLGGAFVGVAEGIDGIYRNPAALANRADRATSFFDVDVTFDWLFVSSADIDWDGDARPLSDAFEFRAVNLGLQLQLGPLGLGALATFYGWDGDGASVSHADVLLGAGWAFDDGALIVGVGATVATLEVDAGAIAGSSGATAELTGGGGDFGVLWRPRDASWRLGARVRTEVRLTDPTTALVTVGVVPWQVSLGWSSFYSPDPGRSYNPRLRAKYTPPRERRYLLLSAEVEVLGATDGYSLESLVGATESSGPRRSGRAPSLALHVGAEGEVIHDLLKARWGAYFEPVRVEGTQSLRPHMTGGLELHLFELLFDWKANFAFDLAPGWENVTIGVGFWK